MTTLPRTAGAAPPLARAFARPRRWFFTLLPALMAVAVFVGFAPTYYLTNAYGGPDLRLVYHLHGLLFTCWMVLIVAQPALVALRRTDVHRRIGSVAAFLIAAMTITAYFVTVDLGRRGAAPPGIPPLVFVVVPFATLIVFPLLTGAALVWKNHPQTHKRLMLIATLELVPAAFGRWPVLSTMGPLAFFGVTDLFVVAMLAYDWTTNGRFHRATIVGGTFLVASQVARIVIGGTETWQTFARWLIS